MLNLATLFQCKSQTSAAVQFKVKSHSGKVQKALQSRHIAEGVETWHAGGARDAGGGEHEAMMTAAAPPAGTLLPFEPPPFSAARGSERRWEVRRLVSARLLAGLLQGALAAQPLLQPDKPSSEAAQQCGSHGLVAAHFELL